MSDNKQTGDIVRPIINVSTAVTAVVWIHLLHRLKTPQAFMSDNDKVVDADNRLYATRFHEQ